MKELGWFIVGIIAVLFFIGWKKKPTASNGLPVPSSSCQPKTITPQSGDTIAGTGTIVTGNPQTCCVAPVATYGLLHPLSAVIYTPVPVKMLNSVKIPVKIGNARITRSRSCKWGGGRVCL